RPGESGEIVLTDLINVGMPMIRHATGDLATAPAGPCDCGCPLPTFSSVEGRTTDTLYRPDGSAVAGVMLPDLFPDVDDIVQVQFVQNSRGSLDVSVVLRPGASRSIESMVVDEIRSVVGTDMTIRVHFVKEIPVNPRSGKFQEVICRIGAPQPAGAGVSPS